MHHKALYLLLLVILFVACAETKREEITLPKNSRFIERGGNLVNGLASCGFCHGQHKKPNTPLSGGQSVFDDYGEVLTPNITPASTGIGDWKVKEIIRAIRHSIGKNGEPLSREAHRGFQWMSDEDVLSIVAYLMTLYSVENKVERRELGTLTRNTIGLFEGSKVDIGYVPPVSRQNKQSYGKYLTDNVARCSVCHSSPGGIFTESSYLAGGKPINIEGNTKLSPSILNLPENGIGSWQEGDLTNYLKTGKLPNGQSIDAKFCPVKFYSFAEDEDISALVYYLKTLKVK